MNGPANGRSDAEREQRIAEIKGQLQTLVGGRMIGRELPGISLAQREQFWEHVLACEVNEGPHTSDFERLLARGVELPPPETLDDASLTAKLWEMIRALDELNVMLESTNHLSDRELYTQLWSHSLRAEVPVSDYEEDGDWHLDMVSTGSEENIRAWLTYYADDKTRRYWHEKYPDDEMPEHCPAPYDRDRILQALYYDAGEPT